MGNEEFTLRNNVTLLDLNYGLRDQRTCLQYEASLERSQKGLGCQMKISQQKTIPKPKKSDWEENTDKLQQKEQEEIEQLNTQARYNFNKKQYQNQKTQQKNKPTTTPTLFDSLE